MMFNMACVLNYFISLLLMTAYIETCQSKQHECEIKSLHCTNNSQINCFMSATQRYYTKMTTYYIRDYIITFYMMQLQNRYHSMKREANFPVANHGSELQDTRLA